MAKCGKETEIYSRVCGYHRPVKNWNKGKREEFKDRKTFKPDIINEVIIDCPVNKRETIVPQPKQKVS